MKRVILTLVLLLVPAVALAQIQDRTTGSNSESAAAPRGQASGDEAAPGEILETPDFGLQGRPPLRPAPPPQPTSLRRRGSMVGYIADAVVSSKIRIRYESGLHNHTPDRAEFFYGKCGCYRDPSLPHDLFDPDAPGPAPGIVTDLKFQQFYIQAEYSGGGRVSVFAELPSRSIQPQTFLGGGSGFTNQSGVGDVRAGAKIGLMSTSRQAATLQVQGYLPTGKAENGLGTGHQSIEPALLLYNAVNDRVAIESQVGLWHPFGGSKGLPNAESDKFAGDVLFYGIGPSVEVFQNGDTRVAPVVELVGWRVLKGSQTIAPGTAADEAAGTNIVNLKIGARIASGQSSFYAGWGHALTTASWYDEILRFEYRFSF